MRNVRCAAVPKGILEIDRIAADRIKNGPHEFIPFEDAFNS